MATQEELEHSEAYNAGYEAGKSEGYQDGFRAATEKVRAALNIPMVNLIFDDGVNPPPLPDPVHLAQEYRRDRGPSREDAKEYRETGNITDRSDDTYTFMSLCGAAIAEADGYLIETALERVKEHATTTVICDACLEAVLEAVVMNRAEGAISPDSE